MQFIIWTGIAVLGLLTLTSVGIVFFHLVGEFRTTFAAKQEDIPASVKPPRRGGMRRVDLEALRDERPPIRRAA